MHGTLDLPALRPAAVAANHFGSTHSVRAADLVPASFDAADRSVELVWSTGARVRRQPLFGEPFDEELSLDPAHVRLERLNGGAPLLKVHDMGTLDAVIGSVVPGTARIENGRGIARVRFSDRVEVEPILADIRAGHLRAVSIGYQVHRFEVSRPAAGPELWRAVDWTPFEISAVPVGADPAAGFRSAEPLSPCVLVRRDAASSPTRIAMDETQTPPAGTDATPPPDTDALVARARETERERVGTIHALAGRLGLERGFADDLVQRGTGLDAWGREHNEMRPHQG